MGISSTDELLAAELFGNGGRTKIRDLGLPKTKTRIPHVPMFFHECVLFVVSWFALRFLELDQVTLTCTSSSCITSHCQLGCCFRLFG